MQLATGGYSDAQLIEIVQHVALNTWTNYPEFRVGVASYSSACAIE